MSVRPADRTDLVKLAEQKFGELTGAERELFRAAAKGELADCSAEKEEDNDPARAAEWAEDRVIKADRIAWLCIDPEACTLVTHAGIGIKGARIDGFLELAFVGIPFPIWLTDCALREGINLQYASIPALNLSRSYTGPIEADGLRVQGALFLREGLKADGGVRLAGAEIGGQLNFAGGEFINSEGQAITASTVRVEGDLFLSGDFKAQGEVNLVGARIGGQLNCDGGEFINRNGAALKADSLDVGTDVFLRNGFRAEGEVRLLGATIGGGLNCIRGRFTNPGADALSADGINVRGAVFLRGGFRAVGKVRFVGAEIGGQLSCDGGQFIVATGTALNASSISVDCDVFLSDDFEAQGEICLLGARIRGNLDCAGASFVNPGRRALNADGLRIGGAMLMRDIRLVQGVVSLVGAEVKGYLVWARISSPAHVALDLSSASIGTLLDDSSSWPLAGRLFLDGFVYEEIHANSPTDADSRIQWLHRQAEKPFRPQPYEQLAAVLQKSGHDEAAKRILIAKNEDRGRVSKLTGRQRFSHRVFGITVRYGYRPWQALWFMLLFLFLGCMFFEVGFRTNVMTPAKVSPYVSRQVTDTPPVSEDYPRFNAFVYSLDAFVPLVDLHQVEYWLPNANRGQELLTSGWFTLRGGGLLCFYLWVHIIAGWILTTLLVVGLTGLVRR